MAWLVNAEVYRTWPEEVLHVGDCEVIPVATYEVRAWINRERYSEPPLEVGTILRPRNWHYGDAAGDGTGDDPPVPGFTPSNRFVNVSDVQAFLLSIQGPSTPSAHTTWVDLHGLGEPPGVCSKSLTACTDVSECTPGEICTTGSPPNWILNVSDLQRILWGIAGQRYTDAPEHLDPGDCP
jgi:hypothetical protein